MGFAMKFSVHDEDEKEQEEELSVGTGFKDDIAKSFDKKIARGLRLMGVYGRSTPPIWG